MRIKCFMLLALGATIPAYASSVHNTSQLSTRSIPAGRNLVAEARPLAQIFPELKKISTAEVVEDATLVCVCVVQTGSGGCIAVCHVEPTPTQPCPTSRATPLPVFRETTPADPTKS